MLFAYKRYFLILLFLCTIGISNIPKFAFGASDGSVDTTSTGSMDLSLSISTLVRVSNVNDFSFGTYSGNGDMVLDDDVCVWTNNIAGTYHIKAQGSGTNHAFTVTNGTTGTMPYTVRWNNTIGTNGNQTLLADEISGSLSGASTTSSTCAGGATANVQIRFSQNVLTTTRPGTYTGVLTLIASP